MTQTRVTDLLGQANMLAGKKHIYIKNLLSLLVFILFVGYCHRNIDNRVDKFRTAKQGGTSVATIEAEGKETVETETVEGEEKGKKRKN